MRISIGIYSSTDGDRRLMKQALKYFCLNLAYSVLKDFQFVFIDLCPKGQSGGLPKITAMGLPTAHCDHESLSF